MFQIVFNLVLLVGGILFLRWLYHKWFSASEKKRSDKLVAKKVELNELKKRKEDLEETVGVTEEAAAEQIAVEDEAVPEKE